MRNTNFLAFIFLFVVSVAFLGCGGGGGGSSNPLGVTTATGPTADLSGQVSMNGQILSNVKVYLYKSNNAHISGISNLTSLKNSVLAQTLNNDGSFTTFTDSQGQYKFSNIPVGEYTLVAVQDENHQFAQTGVLLAATTVVNAQLTPTGSISGRVMLNGASQTPVSGSVVYLEGTSYVALTSATGNFTISHVPASQTFVVRVISDEGSPSGALTAVLAPAENKNLGDILLTPVTKSVDTVVTISGNLRKSGFLPNASSTEGIIVVLVGMNNQDPSVKLTDASGNYSFSVKATGTYAVSVVPGDFVITPPNQTVTVDLTSNVTVPEMVITPKIAVVNHWLRGTINKTLRISDETDNSGVVVNLISQTETGNPAFSTISADNGAFAFKLIPGSYTLSLAGRYELVTPLSFSNPISVATDTDLGTLNVRPKLTVGGEVVGNFTAPTGTSYEVILSRVGVINYEERFTTTTASTSFRFDEIPVGTYSLSLNPARGGHTGTSADFFVGAGQTVSINFSATNVIPGVTASNVTGTTLLTISGSNFVAPTNAGDPQTNAIVNGKNLKSSASGTWSVTNVYYDITDLTPGTYTYVLSNPNGTRSAEKEFFKGMVAPTGFNTSVTDKTVTFNWVNSQFSESSEIVIFSAASIPIATITNILGDRVEYKSLSPNTNYTASLKNKNGSLYSPLTSVSFTTKTAGLDGVSVTELSNTGAIRSSLTVFGFEVLNNHYFIGAYGSDGTEAIIKSFDFSGNEVGTTASITVSGTSIDKYSLCAGDGKIFIMCPSGNGDLMIQAYDAANLSAAPSASVLFNGAPNFPMETATMKFYDSKVFVAGELSGTGMYLFAFNNSLGNLTGSNPILSNASALSVSSRKHNNLLAADESAGKLYYMKCSSVVNPTNVIDNISVFQYSLSDMTAPSTTVASASFKASPYEFVATKNYFILSFADGGGDGQDYKLVPRNSVLSFVPEFAKYKYYSNLFVDNSGRFWAGSGNRMAGSDQMAFVQFSQNGSIENRLPIGDFVSKISGSSYDLCLPAEYIKTQKSDSSTAILFVKSSGILAVAKYNSSF